MGSGLRTLAAAAVVAMAASVGGCSLFEQDGSDDAHRDFRIPVQNNAAEAPPYAEVMGDPMPDKAWLRERASECESWQIGANGCAAPPRVVTSRETTTRRHVVRHVRHVARPKPSCNCGPADAALPPAPAAATPTTPPVAAATPRPDKAPAPSP